MRQGGILSAHLFSIYIDSILTDISKEPYGCYLGINKVNIQAYADDLAIFCPSATGLRKLLLKFETLSNAHDLVININKTKIMIFDKTRKNQRDIKFELNGRKLDMVNNYKYLGTFLSSDLRLNEDIKRLQASFNRKVGMFIRKFHATELSVKLKLFNTMCMDMFGMNLWWDTRGCLGLLKQLAVSYHYGLKKSSAYPNERAITMYVICST